MNSTASEPSPSSSRALTVPNAISAARIASIPVFVALILDHDTTTPGLILFAIVVATDWIDGMIARRTGQVSDLGKVLDYAPASKESNKEPNPPEVRRAALLALMKMGDKWDAATATSMGPGAFHFLPGKMHHSAGAKGETVLQLQSTGPFDIHYLNPADDPTKTAAAK